MNLLLLISTITFLFSSTTEQIPYDWVGQYGLYKNKGIVLFNTDWRSNNLLFDGTWSTFPTMYGELIENDFDKELSVNFYDNYTDSSFSNTDIKYQIGDFSLDQFSFNIEGSEKTRAYNIYAFKRSFLGANNQYYNNSTQPIQQSYFTSLSSGKGNTSGSIQVGHFNTFSNFPDNIMNSEYRQITTTANSKIQHNHGKFGYIISLDNFLQKFRSNHSLSKTTKNRYLTRSMLQGKIKFPKLNSWNTDMTFFHNKRSMKNESTIKQNWNSILISGFNENLDLSLEYGSIDKQSLLSYSFNIEKKIIGTLLKFSFFSESKPSHPFYYSQLDNVVKSLKVEKNISKTLTLNQSLGKSSFQSRIAFNEGINPFWTGNEKSTTLFLKINGQFLSNFNYSVYYNYERDITYHTGGLGDWFGVDLDFSKELFQNNMNLNFRINLKNYNKRVSRIYFNPIEMIPSNDSIFYEFGNMTMLNFRITMKVSSIMFQYDWINLLEILKIHEKSETFNEITFNPMMPKNGWQKQISIVWNFLN